MYVLIFSGRDDKKKVMTRRMLVKQIDELYNAMVDGLKEELASMNTSVLRPTCGPGTTATGRF